jgi:hypothetical protein
MNVRIYNILILVLVSILTIVLLFLCYNIEEYYDINDSDIDENICKQWFINRTKIPIINPVSGKVIKKNKSTYKIINTKCKKYEKINKKYKNIESVPDYLKVLYKMLFDGYVKLITSVPSY